MTDTCKIIDTKHNRVAFAKVSEAEAHKRVDILNSAAGARRYRVEVPGQMVGMD